MALTELAFVLLEKVCSSPARLNTLRPPAKSEARFGIDVVQARAWTMSWLAAAAPTFVPPETTGNDILMDQPLDKADLACF